MKRILRNDFFVALGLAISLCACAPAPKPSPEASIKPSELIPAGSPEPSPSPAEALPGDPAALSALRAVLTNEETFCALMEQGTSEEPLLKECSLEEWLAQWPRPYMTIDCWALCDFDQDGTPEVICNQCMGDNPYVERLILRYQDGAVYGYARPYRGLGTPKTDGTFDWSDGAFNFGCAAMSFDRECCTVRDISYCRLEYGEENGRHYVNGLEVTKSEFDAAMEDQDAKPDVEWYDYTEDIISEIFSGVI